MLEKADLAKAEELVLDCSTCPSDYAQICECFLIWATEVHDWSVSVKQELEQCCEEAEVGAVPAVPDPDQCSSDGKAVWRLFVEWGIQMYGFFRCIEATLELCFDKGAWRHPPKPKRPKKQTPKALCAVIRKYARKYQRWGAQVSDIINDNCAPAGQPGRVPPPPDPPFGG